IARAEARILGLRDRLLERWRLRAGRRRAVGTPPVVVRPLTDREGAPVPAGRPAARAPVYLAPGPHTSRAERSPVTPAGSARQPPSERHSSDTSRATGPCRAIGVHAPAPALAHHAREPGPSPCRRRAVAGRVSPSRPAPPGRP